MRSFFRIVAISYIAKKTARLPPSVRYVRISSQDIRPSAHCCKCSRLTATRYCIAFLYRTLSALSSLPGYKTQFERPIIWSRLRVSNLNVSALMTRTINSHKNSANPSPMLSRTLRSPDDSLFNGITDAVEVKVLQTLSKRVTACVGCDTQRLFGHDASPCLPNFNFKPVAIVSLSFITPIYDFYLLG